MTMRLSGGSLHGSRALTLITSAGLLLGALSLARACDTGPGHDDWLQPMDCSTPPQPTDCLIGARVRRPSCSGNQAGVAWFVWPIPMTLDTDRVEVGDSDVKAYLQAAMDQWTLTGSLAYSEFPYDGTNGHSGATSFQLGWTSQEDLTDPSSWNRPAGEVAYTRNVPSQVGCNPNTLCLIEETYIVVSANPRTASGVQLYWFDPGHAANNWHYLSLKSALLHEYGHALGLGHAANPAAVMNVNFGSSLPADASLSSTERDAAYQLYQTNAAHAPGRVRSEAVQFGCACPAAIGQTFHATGPLCQHE